MKALLLNGGKTDNDTTDKISEISGASLKKLGYKVDHVVLRRQKIGGCLGCFGCWLKTPGLCVIKDDAYELSTKVAESDLLLLVSPVTFGMYSADVKKALDRIACPVLLPFFTKINGEVHHKARYAKNPLLLAVGVLQNSDEESSQIFQKLVHRNAVNLHTADYSIAMHLGDSPGIIENKIKSLFGEAGVR